MKSKKKSAHKLMRSLSSHSAPKDTKAAAQLEDPFRHVVVLMLENRSFDHMLGALQKDIKDLDGIPSTGSRRTNLGPDGGAYAQEPCATAKISPDPMHETPNVLDQIKDNNGRFVKDYARAYPSPRTTPEQWKQVMAYHDAGPLEPLHTLARSFAVCDAWFSSVPGSTWTRRRTMRRRSPISCGSNQRTWDPKRMTITHDLRYGQKLIASVYEAIRANDGLWRSTLLVIAYDEHGGFYDHVPTQPLPFHPTNITRSMLSIAPACAYPPCWYRHG
jgi:phospholipase C